MAVQLQYIFWHSPLLLSISIMVISGCNCGQPPPQPSGRESHSAGLRKQRRLVGVSWTRLSFWEEHSLLFTQSPVQQGRNHWADFTDVLSVFLVVSRMGTVFQENHIYCKWVEMFSEKETSLLNWNFGKAVKYFANCRLLLLPCQSERMLTNTANVKLPVLILFPCPIVFGIYMSLSYGCFCICLDCPLVVIPSSYWWGCFQPESQNPYTETKTYRNVHRKLRYCKSHSKLR